jgi:DNA-binding CsgD family transcriptional regulator
MTVVAPDTVAAPIKESLQCAADGLAELLGDTCITLLLSGDGRWLQTLGLADPDPEAAGRLEHLAARPLPLTGGFAKKALATGASLRLPVTSSEVLLGGRPELGAYATHSEISSLVHAPMRAAGRVRGLVTVLRRRDIGPLTAHDEHVVQLVADMLGVALTATDDAGCPPADLRPTEDFTARDLEVLALLARGYTNREIAAQLVLSVRTIEWYRRRVQLKLGVSGRAALAEAARAAGLIH